MTNFLECSLWHLASLWPLTPRWMLFRLVEMCTFQWAPSLGVSVPAEPSARANSLCPIHWPAWLHLIYHPAINQGITNICALKLYMILMTFKLVYELMHFANFNKFSAQASYYPYMSMIKKNIFFCAVSTFLAQLMEIYRSPTFNCKQQSKRNT